MKHYTVVGVWDFEEGPKVHIVFSGHTSEEYLGDTTDLFWVHVTADDVTAAKAAAIRILLRDSDPDVAYPPDPGPGAYTAPGGLYLVNPSEDGLWTVISPVRRDDGGDVSTYLRWTDVCKYHGIRNGTLIRQLVPMPEPGEKK